MDPRTRRMVGWVVALVGLIVAVVGGLADQIGLGGEGPDEFGGKQVVAVVVGAVILVAGLALALWPAGRRPGPAGVPEPPAEPSG